MCQEVSLYRRRDISGPGVTKVRYCCPQNGSSNGLLMIRVRRSCVIPATCLKVTHIKSDVQYLHRLRAKSEKSSTVCEPAFISEFP